MIFEKSIMKIYKNTLLTRHDPDGTVFYFSKNDFDGLLSDDFTFLGDKGQKLSAHIYYKGEKRNDRIIIFEHGMGAGHRAYMSEIDLIASRGYTVFTYDHTGTLDSEGEHIGGFSQSLSDLVIAVKSLKEINEFKNSALTVIGHSWGGFSSMNIPNIYPEITHTVSLSGFISPRLIQAQNLGGILKLYRCAAYRVEYSAFPEYADTDARNRRDDVKTKSMLIHSKDDKIVSFSMNFEALRAKFKNDKRFLFIETYGKNHNPSYTLDAIKYKSAFFNDLRKKNKKGELKTDEEKAAFVSSYNWRRMTEQDMDIWNMIFEFIEN